MTQSPLHVRPRKPLSTTPSAVAQREWRLAHPGKSAGYNRKRYKAHPEKLRNSQHKSYYSMDLEGRAIMHSLQGRRCFCCGAEKPGDKKWHMHHLRGTRRGICLLCKTCNAGSGMFADDPDRLRRMADINSLLITPGYWEGGAP